MTLITRRVCLEAKHMNSDIYRHLLEKIKFLTKNELSKEHGYILDVKEIKEIKENWISSANSDIVFTVEFEADTLKPEKDKELTGTVCMVFKGGIFIIVQDKLKVLVRESSLKGYTLDKVRMCYENGDKYIEREDELTVKITETQYSEKTFSCYGDLVV